MDVTIVNWQISIHHAAAPAQAPESEAKTVRAARQARQLQALAEQRLHTEQVYRLQGGR